MKYDHTVSSTTGRWILIATILASSMAFIDGTALNIALPVLQQDLDASGGALLWIVNGYLLTLAALILIGGALGDHYGRKRIFGIGIIVFAAASLFCGLAPDETVLIVARLIQGVGGALMVPGSLAIITATFAEHERGRAIGIWSAASTITTFAGPVLGGILTDSGLWRGVFFINLPVALVALFALRYVPENKDPDAAPKLDYPGAILATFGLAGLTYGLISLGEQGIDQAGPLSWVTLVAGIIGLVIFVIVERRSANPMVNLGLFKSRTFSGANAMTAFLYGALSAALLFFPINLIQIQGYSPAIAGFVMIPFTILLAVLSPWAGGLVDRIGPRLPLTVGPAIVGIGFWLLSLPGITAGPDTYWTTYFPGIIGLGLGMGITVAPLTTAVMGSAPQTQSGVASAINNAVTRSAQVLASAVIGAVALIVFSSTLMAAVDDLNLSDTATVALQEEAIDLANAEIPDGLSDTQQDAVQTEINESFVETFQLLVRIAAVMSFISAAMAAIIIEGHHKRKRDEESPAPAD